MLRQHSGTSLFVRPICWTDLHTKLLGAKFEELPPCDSPSPSSQPGSGPSQGHMQPSPAITILSSALSEILQPSAVQSILSSNSVKVTLMTLWPGAFSKPQYLPELNLFWGGKVYHDAVRVQAMWNYPTTLSTASSQTSFETVATHPLDPQLAPSSPSTSATVSISSSSAGSTPLSPMPPPSLPMLCYVGKNRSSLIRRSMFRVCQGPSMNINMPVFRLQQLRSKALMPLDPDQDAHLVGIFLAMAQRHFYGVPPTSARRESYWWPQDKGRPPRPDFHDLKLRVLTSDSETAEFIVYTGHVTAAFLDRFHDPFANPGPTPGAPGGVPGIRIGYTRVPVWPILGLRERLGKALGHDIVGPFDPTQMETWHESDVDTELELSSSDEDETPPAAEEPSDRTSRKRTRTRDRDRDRDKEREPLAHRFDGSYDSESGGEQDLGAKKRRLDEGNRVGVVV
ncbi:hypothetical protein ESCO_001828 [Escovopsis weberi]|uniref:Uncharacterized protein n=1 Tax=Escovopsis weberi TaxID=150374 RepID=A0A0M8N7X4_ESCWE|nr:hypothetical protein ESCO_001828 [Escovopsis weberi]